MMGKVDRMGEGALGMKHEVKVALAGIMPGLEASLHERLGRLEQNYTAFKNAMEVCSIFNFQ
jgi:hypothetical protein